jgi:hypothetical protein
MRLTYILVFVVVLSGAGGPPFRFFFDSFPNWNVGAPSLHSLQGRDTMLSVLCDLSCRAACIALTAPIICTS